MDRLRRSALYTQHRGIINPVPAGIQQLSDQPLKILAVAAAHGYVEDC